jgi:cytidylate kinase
MEKDLLEGFARYLDSRRSLLRQASKIGLPCITISRQMGSGGLEIAELLTNRLAERSQQAWMVFDRILAEMVWKDHNLPAPLGPFFQEEIPQAVRDTVQEILGIRMTGGQMVEHTAATILRLASLGNAIFIGRGANIITANQKSVLYVRLMAPFATRVRQIEEHHRLSTQEAVELITTTDETRRRYVMHHFRAEIDDPINYHLVINTGLTGYDEAARLIANATMEIQARA